MSQAKIKRTSFAVIAEKSFQRALTGETLRALGASQIENAVSVEDALELFRRMTPQAVLCDWDLPGINGLDFTLMVRHSKTTLPPDTAIILVTDRSSPQDVETARRVGVDEYAIKPFTTEVLARRLDSVLNRRRAFVNSPRYRGPCRRRKLDSQYEGPLRRFVDEDRVVMESPANEALKAEAKARLQAVRAAIGSDGAVSRGAIRDLHGAAKDIGALSIRLDDRLLRNAAFSLQGYIEAVGASGLFDGRVAEAHLDAMSQLVALPNAQIELREQVALALKALVAKKTSAR